MTHTTEKKWEILLFFFQKSQAPIKATANCFWEREKKCKAITESNCIKVNAAKRQSQQRDKNLEKLAVKYDNISETTMVTICASKQQTLFQIFLIFINWIIFPSLTLSSFSQTQDSTNGNGFFFCCEYLIVWAVTNGLAGRTHSQYHNRCKICQMLTPPNTSFASNNLNVKRQLVSEKEKERKQFLFPYCDLNFISIFLIVFPLFRFLRLVSYVFLSRNNAFSHFLVMIVCIFISVSFVTFGKSEKFTFERILSGNRFSAFVAAWIIIGQKSDGFCSKMFYRGRLSLDVTAVGLS